MSKPKGKKMENEMGESIIVNGKTYYANSAGKEYAGDYKIVILQRGWVMVGKLERDGSECKLHHASVIRNWGTTKGLGELAAEGPKKDTKIDKCNGLVEFDYLTVVASIAANEDAWKSAL